MLYFLKFVMFFGILNFSVVFNVFVYCKILVLFLVKLVEILNFRGWGEKNILGYEVLNFWVVVF